MTMDNPHVASIIRRFLKSPRAILALDELQNRRRRNAHHPARGDAPTTVHHHIVEDVFADNISHWLLGVSMAEVARIAGWIPPTLPGDDVLLDDLRDEVVAPLYTGAARMPLVVATIKRLSGESAVFDRAPGSFAIFARVTEAHWADVNANHFCEVLENVRGKQSNIWHRTMAIVASPRAFGDALTTAEEEPDAGLVRGGVAYLAFLGQLHRILLNLAAHPALGTAMWAHHRRRLSSLGSEPGVRLRAFADALGGVGDRHSVFPAIDALSDSRWALREAEFVEGRLTA